MQFSLKKDNFANFSLKITWFLTLFTSQLVSHKDTPSASQWIRRSNRTHNPCCHCICTDIFQPVDCSHPGSCSSHNSFPSPSKWVINFSLINWSVKLLTWHWQTGLPQPVHPNKQSYSHGQAKITFLSHIRYKVGLRKWGTLIKWGVSSWWLSSLYCPMRNPVQMTTWKTQPTL